MKKKILIVTKNNLSENFWYQYIDAEHAHITIVKNKHVVIPALYMLLPEVILLDNYFQPSDTTELIEIARSVNASSFKTRIFCLSQGFSAEDREKIAQIPEINVYRFNQEFCDSLELIFAPKQNAPYKKTKNLRHVN